MIYETLCAINRSFDQVLQGLEQLQRSHLFRGHEFLESCGLMVAETRAWACFEVLEILRDREEGDWARLGRLCGARERKLGDPGDILIEAERVRSRLAKKTGRTKQGTAGKSRFADKRF